MEEEGKLEGRGINNIRPITDSVQIVAAMKRLKTLSVSRMRKMG